MKKNNPETNQEFEKMFRDKMHELSSSVDCFDRISARAFPEKNPDFSESGFTVCDLENITGKSKKPKIIRWTAVVAACAVCAFVLPQTRIVSNLIASIGGNSKKTYSKIIEEINTETSQNTYKIYDLPLDEYIKYDRLVTPLYPCPFDDCGKDNINVRIFVRTYNDVPTNQIYAVEYTGEYKKSNFIAVADTKAKFSEDDLKYIDEIYVTPDDMDVSLAVMANFTPVSTAESFMTDRNDNKISLASFGYENIFKNDDEQIFYRTSQFIYYGDRTDEYPETYYFDINNPDAMNGTWKDTVCFDGFSSMPEENKSLFIETPIFDRQETSGEAYGYAYITPETLKNDNENEEINFCSLALNSYGEETISTFAVPYDNEIFRNMKMYFSKSGLMLSSDSEAAVVLKSENSEETEVVSFYDEGCHDLLTEEQQEELMELWKEQEIQAEEQATAVEVVPEDVPEIESYIDYRF